MSTTRLPTRSPREAQRPSGIGARRPRPTAPEPVVAEDRPTTTTAQARVGLRRLFTAVTADYVLVLGTALFLVLFGLVMVLSASSVEAEVASDNPFSDFQRQGLYALLGIPLMLVASRMPPRFWQRWSWGLLGLGMLLQLLVFTPLGVGNDYNRNWVQVGGVAFQPSELLKLALVVWMAGVLSRKQNLLGDWRHALLPVGPVAALALLLVLLGNDVGTASIMLIVVFGVLFYAGVKLRHLLVWAAIVATLGAVVVMSGSSRAARIDAWMHGCTSVSAPFCWQPVHGMWGLASGGVLGVGLGNSKMKWSWLPEAANDFIVAIIGEELGLVGLLLLLALFVVLAIGLVRIARRSPTMFGRVAVGGVLIWVVGQAFANVAVVLGLLPVLGVPLPFISSGGSSLIATLVAIGVVLSFTRGRTDAAELPLESDDDPAARSRAAARARSATR